MEVRRKNIEIKEKIGSIVYVTIGDLTKAIIKDTKFGLGTLSAFVKRNEKDEFDLEKARTAAKAKLMIKLNDKILDHFYSLAGSYEEVMTDSRDYIDLLVSRLINYQNELYSLCTTGELEFDFWPKDSFSNKGTVSYIIYGLNKKDKEELTHTKCIINDDTFGRFVGVAKHPDPDTFDICIGGRIAFLRAIIKLNKKRLTTERDIFKHFNTVYKKINKQINHYTAQGTHYFKILGQI